MEITSKTSGKIFRYGPVTSVEQMKLSTVFDDLGHLQPEPTRFTHEILWVRDAFATVSFWHGGMEIEFTQETFCDTEAKGFLASIPEAIQNAELRCLNHVVSMESTLIVQVRANIRDFPVLRLDNSDPYQYAPLPHDWLLDDPTLTWPYENWTEKNVQPLIVISNQIIWSSKWAISENVLILDRFKKRWTVPA